MTSIDNNLITVAFLLILRTDVSLVLPFTGAPKENILQNHLNVAFLNVFWYLNGTDISMLLSPKNFSFVRSDFLAESPVIRKF